MLIHHGELNRFQLEGRLGEGADSEVFAATDIDTGQPVVVKRPHPALIARRQHQAVERRIAKVISLRQRLADVLPHVTRMVAYTEPAPHSLYFGDSLSEEYSVVVEERALGIPLVGSASDGIKRHPIGLPQNLFDVHPVVPHARRGRFSIVRDLLEVAETFHRHGVLVLDLRPQNVYFDPATASITVIDIGGISEERPAEGGKPPLDLHDFYLELFKWHMPILAPPIDIDGYQDPIGMETIPMFNQNLDSMIRQHEFTENKARRTAALDILHNVRARAYSDIQPFKRDIEPYLSLLEERYERLLQCKPMRQGWQDGLSLLTTDYWRKFRFDPDSLASYDAYQTP